MASTSDSTPSGKSKLTPPDGEDNQAKFAEAFAHLEAELEQCRDHRKEERFVWIALTTILATMLFLHDSPSEFLPLAVVILELPLLFFLAKKLGIESVAELFDRLIGDIGRAGKNGG